MFLWNTRAAAERLRSGPVASREAAGSVVGLVALRAVGQVPWLTHGGISLLDRLNWLISLGIAVLAVAWWYRANGANEGNNLVERALVLLLPVAVRLGAVQLVRNPVLILGLGLFLRKTQPALQFTEVYRIGQTSPLGMLLSTTYALVAILWVAHLLRCVAALDRPGEQVA